MSMYIGGSEFVLREWSMVKSEQEATGGSNVKRSIEDRYKSNIKPHSTTFNDIQPHSTNTPDLNPGTQVLILNMKRKTEQRTSGIEQQPAISCQYPEFNQ